jgi:hypothetical protein
MHLELVQLVILELLDILVQPVLKDFLVKHPELALLVQQGPLDLLDLLELQGVQVLLGLLDVRGLLDVQDLLVL